MSKRVMNLGTLLNKPTKIYTPERRSTEGPVPICTLYWGDYSIRLDRMNMQPRLAKLIPSGWCTTRVTPEQWIPFIRTAFLMGELK